MVAIAGGAGKLKIFNWGPGLAESGSGAFLKSLFTDPNLLVLATLNGFFGSMAAFGTDQETMQRLLTVETRRESQKTMLLTPIGSFLVMVIFLFIGACLYAFYAQHPGMPLPAKLDKIFPHFIEQAMPPLMRGLMLAAIVMASIDSPLGSLTSSFVTDIYRPVLLSRELNATICSFPEFVWLFSALSWRSSPTFSAILKNSSGSPLKLAGSPTDLCWEFFSSVF